jgi:hypothetical protein
MWSLQCHPAIFVHSRTGSQPAKAAGMGAFSWEKTPFQ